MTLITAFVTAAVGLASFSFGLWVWIDAETDDWFMRRMSIITMLLGGILIAVAVAA